MKKESLQDIGYRSARQTWAEELPVFYMKAYGYQGCVATAGMPSSDSWVFRVDGEARIARSARIQSKYTWSSRNTKIEIESPHFDFLVVVQDIKQGFGVCLRDRMRYWVIPHKHFKQIHKVDHINIKNIDPMYQQANAVDNIWQPVIDFLED